MEVQLLDVVDTAVKVGLGALISGVATYYVTKLKHDKETIEGIRQRKLAMVVDALDTADSYMIALGNVFAALDGLRKDHPHASTIQ